MKIKFLLYLFSCFLSYFTFSQNKVVWENTYNSKTETIEMTASIAEGWHLYSQHVNNQIGPVPTQFKFTVNDLVELKGNVNEPKAIQEYDENFEATLDFFKEKVMFTQKVSAKKTTDIEVVITYMVCNDVMCLPPVDEKYKIELKSK